MRTNLPVTQREVTYGDNETIVSVTDLKGKILHCNHTFVRISGFTREELLGQPQNIIRHPDMPSEAFRDLWATISVGSPWKGLVKNRCKNGDHYWVNAAVVPILKDGQPSGYMSVRTKPTHDEVAAADALYAAMREANTGDQVRMRLRGGVVVRTGVVGAVHRATSITLGMRMAVALLATALAGGASALLPFAEPWKMLAGGVMTLSVAAITWLWLQAVIVKPVLAITDHTHALAAGDLTHRIERDAGNDEIGQLIRCINQLGVNLQAVVGDVRREVESLDVTAKEISGGSDDLSGRAASQAASLEETAASMHELNASVRQTTEVALSANTLAEQNRAAAENGSHMMAEVVATMNEIREASRRIADIIGLIDSIAFQTNILALNAAVEAARAGEQGRGFAVVASEVRDLAQRSAQAAGQIKQLISGTVSKVQTGTEQVERAGEAIKGIVTIASKASTHIGEISHAANEQAMGVAQINDAISSLDEATQHNAALAEELSAASNALHERATILDGAVRVFHLS